MPTVLQLKEERATVWGEMTALMEREDSWSAEDSAKYDALESDLDARTKRIERAERHEARSYHLEALEPDPVETDEVPADARGGSPERSPQERAFDAWLRRGVAGVDDELREHLRMAPPDGVDEAAMRAQGISPDTAGGYLVPQGFRNVVTETREFYGGIRGNVDRIETETGAELPWPTNDDTGNEGAYLGEHDEVPEQDLEFGEARLQAHILTSKMIKVSLVLLQDSGINLDNFIGRKAGERVGRRENRAFTVGSGVGQPLGLQTAAVTGKTGANGQTDSVIWEDLVDLEHSIDPAYRNERSAFMWHDLSLASVRKLKDGDDRPLWDPSVQAGVPDRFMGHRYVVNNHMPVMAADAKSILFGDFVAGYIIRDVRAISMTRLVERFAERLQVAFFLWTRHDGKPVDLGAYKAYANSSI